MKKVILFLMLAGPLAAAAGGKDKPRPWSLTGHLQDLQMVAIDLLDEPGFEDTWFTMSTISNRLDFRWYPKSWLRMHAGMRNILNYGQIIEYANAQAQHYNTPGYHDIVVDDQGFADLTFSIADEYSYFIYSTVDRANAAFTRNNFEATIGRQRINWGINRVWTPNDIFNTFNYFDFDYVERPGCDAVFLQYHTSPASSAQAAVKLDHNHDITAAGMYQFLVRNYDLQFLGGVMKDDAVLGMGWSGQIKGAGFNGEMTWFHSTENFTDSTGRLVASIGANYTMNKWYVQVSGLYNSKGTTGKAGYGENLFSHNRNISAKNFTLARYSVFGLVSCRITPLIKTDVSGMFNPSDGSCFIGPSVDFSLTQNIGLLILGQLFYGEGGTEFGDYGKLAYIRLKWSF
ncbi:MAG: hypothetical protein R6T99_05065 [Bacteroidales bacterium]